MSGTGRARRWVAVLAAFLAVGLVAAACSSGSDAESGAAGTSAPPVSAAPGKEIRVGALLSLTGPGSTLGTTSEAALQIAVQEWNDHLRSQGRDELVVLDVEDTALDPARATAAFERLADRGAKVVIGPQSSGEVAVVGPLADQRGVLVVSQGSTASSLAGAAHQVLRFVPTDRVEGRATADLITAAATRVVVPVNRDDAGNRGLVTSVRSAATADGLHVTEGVTYPTSGVEPATVLAQVAAQVAPAIAQVGAGQVVVYLAGFEEVAELLAAAGSVAPLSEVRWYGGDGSAQATQLVDDQAAAAFAAAQGGFPSPLVALPADRAAEDAELLDRISDEAGNDADAFTMAAYDALNVAVEAVLEVGPAAGPVVVREAVVRVANGYVGTTGPIQLDAAGDRVSTPYAFWSVCERDGSPTWVRTSTWTPAADPTRPGTLGQGICFRPAP